MCRASCGISWLDTLQSFFFFLHPYSSQFCFLDFFFLLFSGLPLDKIKKCIGDPEADVENEVLKAEQVLQVGQGDRGDVTILPTLIINNAQYRGLFRSFSMSHVCLETRTQFLI